MEPQARVPRMRGTTARRAAAATNTSFFVAQARERAAGAAAKSKGRKQRKAWDARGGDATGGPAARARRGC